MLGKKTYAVKIQPGIDMVIVVAMCICLHEMRSGKRNDLSKSRSKVGMALLAALALFSPSVCSL
jgi:hypothetical protein